MKRLVIAAGVREAIAAHLVKEYPREGCGVLIGSAADGVVRIVEVAGVRNGETSRGEDRFKLDPFEYAALEKKLSARNDGAQILGFFHSHPDGKPQPSNVDLESAQGLFEFSRTSYLYAIQTIENGRAADLTFWQLAPNGSAWIQLSAE